MIVENKQKVLNIALLTLIAIVLINLIILDIKFFSAPQKSIKPQETKVETIKEVTKIQQVPAASTKPIDIKSIQNYIETELEKAIATVSAEINKLKNTQSSVQTITQQQTSQNQSTLYVTLGGSVSTSNRDWSYVGGSEAYFNKADYKGAKKISFEAFLKINSGNGEANARLYDATNKVVISDSEIFGGGETFVLRSTPVSNLMDGNNLYQVQLRSTTGYEAYMDGARFKIEY